MRTPQITGQPIIAQLKRIGFAVGKGLDVEGA
jgi:hypothetical protein